MLEHMLIKYARSFPIRRGKLRLIDALWRSGVGNGGMHRVSELKYGQFRMPCDLTEILQRQFYFFGTYFVEEEILDCWSEAARGAHVVFDIGANAGIYSLAALAVQRNATVHAFEPTPEIALRLQVTAKLNGLDRLHVHQKAVSSTEGFATLRRCRGELGANEGMNYLATGDGTSAPDAPGSERVETTSLDRFCLDRSIHYVDLMKIDIQGHEYSALMGASRLVRSGSIGMIFAELNWAVEPGALCPATESIRMLADAGYRFSPPGPRLIWKESGDWLRRLSDVVALSPHSKA